MHLIARAPLRITLAGGGTDLPFYSSRFGGFMISVAINHQMNLVVNRQKSDELIKVKTLIHEEVETPEELKYDLARAALLHMGVRKNVELIFYGDISGSGGTGLGTSGAILVNLMNVLHRLKGVRLDTKELAEAAAHVEINMLGRPIGKQDHYMAAFGGLRALTFETDGSVDVQWTGIDQSTLHAFRDWLLLFYTNQKRQSGVILGAQAEAPDEAKIPHYHRIKKIGLEMCDALRQGNFVRFGELTHRHWEIKRELPGGTTNVEIDAMYELGRTHGAIGGKIVGAGGGGYILFVCEPEKQAGVREAMAVKGLRELPFEFDFHGAELRDKIFE